MRYLMLILAAVSLFGAPAFAATCSSVGICTACKNCRYCKNCAKLGGTCSVCKKKEGARAAARHRHSRRRKG